METLKSITNPATWILGTFALGCWILAMYWAIQYLKSVIRKNLEH